MTGAADRINAILAAGMPANTRRCYEAALRYFRAWAFYGDDRVADLPFSPEYVELFVIQHIEGLPAELDMELVVNKHKAFEGRQSVATIHNKLKGISWAHRQLGLADPTRTETIRRMLNAARRAEARAGKVPKRSKAITKDLVMQFIGALDKRSLTGKRNAAVLEFGFFAGGRRRAEIAGACAEFLTPSPWGGMRYWLHRSKTDQAGRGAEKLIKAKNSKHLKRWIKAARIKDSGPLFCLIDRKGRPTARPIYPELVNNIIKYCADACGLDPEQYSAHGLRRGFLTECGRRGVGIERAMEMTDHKDYKTALIYYEQGKLETNPATDL